MKGKAIYQTRKEMELIELCLDNVEPDDFIEPYKWETDFIPDHEAYKAWHSVKDKLFSKH
ncbi:hypothetical protein P9B58_04040 [Bacillus mojavensis]|uniref:hypothetical protein n=1 Tax=Bacillus mojavensis TaxID=72360 RepID=UPI002DB95975|nr:hypothetical protein [Bacillus mojavensis]MEC1289449.1 hypothetical protein [Bacillus mojavensis]MEC1612636.1 hypothetical protein [Bacillus mojavensis]MEC1704660.1 hypothetical protein [Bacillus mojavensis]MEC5246158.1 hypothetical protein [Bacillus mojavensis]